MSCRRNVFAAEVLGPVCRRISTVQQCRKHGLYFDLIILKVLDDGAPFPATVFFISCDALNITLFAKSRDDASCGTLHTKRVEFVSVGLLVVEDRAGVLSSSDKGRHTSAQFLVEEMTLESPQHYRVDDETQQQRKRFVIWTPHQTESSMIAARP